MTERAPISRRIILAGASGTIGRAVAARLVADGHKVTALLRPCSAGESLPELAGAKVAHVALDGAAGLARVMETARA